MIWIIPFSIIIIHSVISTHYFSSDFDGISDEADNISRWPVPCESVGWF